MGVEEIEKGGVKQKTHTHLHTVLDVEQLWLCLNMIYYCRRSKTLLSFIIVGCPCPLFSSVSIQQINNRPITALAGSLVQLFVYVLQEIIVVC